MKKAALVTRGQLRRVMRVLVEQCDGRESHTELAEKCGMTPQRLTVIMIAAKSLGLVNYEPQTVQG